MTPSNTSNLASPEISGENLGMGVPEAVFMLTDSMLIFDHVRQSIVVVAHATIDAETDAKIAYSEATERIEALIDRLNQPLPASAMRRSGAPTHALSRADDANIDYTFVGSAAAMPAGWYTDGNRRGDRTSIRSEHVSRKLPEHGGSLQEGHLRRRDHSGGCIATSDPPHRG